MLQRFALKPKPRKFLKVLLRNTFKDLLVVRLIGNCCKDGNLYILEAFSEDFLALAEREVLGKALSRYLTN